MWSIVEEVIKYAWWKGSCKELPFFGKRVLGLIKCIGEYSQNCRKNMSFLRVEFLRWSDKMQEIYGFPKKNVFVQYIQMKNG